MSDQGGAGNGAQDVTIRFGNLINIDGSDEFKTRVVQVAVQTGMEIEFSNQAMEVARKALVNDAPNEAFRQKTVDQTVKKTKDKEEMVEHDNGPEL